MSQQWNGQIVQSVTASANHSTSDLSVAIGSPLTAGNLVLAVLTWENAAAPAITFSDTLAQSWAHFGQVAAGGSTGIDIYYKLNSAGGADTFTFHSATDLYKSIGVYEYPGLATTALDASTSASGTSNSPAASLTPSAIGNLVFAACVAPSDGSARVAVADNFTCRNSLYDNSIHVDLLAQDSIALNTNALSCGWRLSGSIAWACIQLAFKNMGPAAAGGGSFRGIYLGGGM